jgi:predicted transposase YbfD/YdcC
MCNNSTRVCRTLFPPKDPTAAAQTCEKNRGRIEARCLIPFAASSQAIHFPFVEQAARLTRCSDSAKHPAQDIETEYLLSSRASSALPAQAMLQADRGYWAIEAGLHLRLDVSLGEDRSRVRHRTSALNLAMMRRAVVSIAVHWIRRCSNPRKATTSGFLDAMAANQSRKAFSLVTACHPSWLPTS